MLKHTHLNGDLKYSNNEKLFRSGDFENNNKKATKRDCYLLLEREIL